MQEAFVPGFQLFVHACTGSFRDGYRAAPAVLAVKLQVIGMRLFAAAAVAALATGCATPVDQQPPLELVRVHEVQGKTKAELCRSARDWAAMTFRDSKAVIEVFDAEAGTMIGKGAFLLVSLADVSTGRFTLSVQCKDGRLRATYGDVSIGSKFGERPPMDMGGLLNERVNAEAKLKELDDSLKAHLTKQASADW